ncbi:MAG: carboxypeptidase regulatory-like domain-containing protein [Planctomycetota bacterium]|nr:carboxypeptidase regulatory-like domain-containing protein [Planctomycetota bacterium]
MKHLPLLLVFSAILLALFLFLPGNPSTLSVGTTPETSADAEYTKDTAAVANVTTVDEDPGQAAESPTRVAKKGRGPASIKISTVMEGASAPIAMEYRIRSRSASLDDGSGGEDTGFKNAQAPLLVKNLEPLEYTVEVRSIFGLHQEKTMDCVAGETTEVHFSLALAGAIQGKLTDSVGQPIQGAALLAKAWNKNDLARKVRAQSHMVDLEKNSTNPKFTTDADGIFLIPALDAGAWEIFAYAEGFQTAVLTGEVNVEAGILTTLDERSLLEAATLELTVVHGESKKPVQGVSAQWSPENLRAGLIGLDFWRISSHLTDEQGKIRLTNLPNIPIVLKLTLDEVEQAFDISPWQGSLHLPDPGVTTEKTIALQTGFGLVVHVTDEITGEKLDDFGIIELQPTQESLIGAALLRNQKSDYTPIQTSAEQGIRFHQIPEGKWTLRIEKKGYAPLESESFSLGLENPLEQLQLSMVAGASLLVHTLDGEGNPLSESIIQIAGLDGKSEAVRTAGEDGSWLEPNLKPGKYQVLLVPQDEKGQTDILFEFVTLHAGEQIEVTLQPSGDCSLRGTLTKGGMPQPNTGYAILAGTGLVRGETDEQGMFFQEKLKSGLVTLIVGAVGGVGSNHQTTAELFPGENEVDIHLPGGEVTVHVVDSSTGESIAGMTVAAREKMARGNPKLSVTDADGIATLEFLESGEWELAAGKMVMPLFGGPETYGATMLSITYEEGVSTEVTLELGPGASFRTQVLGTDGNPVAGASVFYLDKFGQPLSQLSVKSTNSKGVRQLDGLPAGPGRILVRHPEAGTVEVPVDLIAGELTKARITLEMGCTVFVQAVDEEGYPVKGVLVNAIDDRGSPISATYSVEQSQRTNVAFIQGGAQSIGPLPPGRYTLLLYRLGIPPRRHDLVIDAGVPEMYLELQP